MPPQAMSLMLELGLHNWFFDEPGHSENGSRERTNSEMQFNFQSVRCILIVWITYFSIRMGENGNIREKRGREPRIVRIEGHLD
jgi:hypothetical protein